MKKTNKNITQILTENRFKLVYDLNYLKLFPKKLYKINMPKCFLNSLNQFLNKNIHFKGDG